MGPGSDGPLGAMAGMEPHHMNGSLGNSSLQQTEPTTQKCLICTKDITLYLHCNPLNSHFKNIFVEEHDSSIFYSTFLIVVHIVLGSGDMDGMNKVNNMTKLRVYAFIDLS